MIRYALLCALPTLAALPVRAQTAAGAASEAAAFAGPVASAFAAAGTERVAGLGFTSLTALSAPDASGRPAFLSAPRMLGPLAEAVRAQGVEPAAFAALGTDAKLAVLARAAVPAEAHAAALADAAIAAAAEPVRVGTYKDVSAKAAAASEVAAYLSPDRAEKVAEAAAAVVAYEKKRAELIEAFIHDLPGRLAEGEINADNLIRRDEDGWRAADEHPDRRYETVEKLYAARFERLDRAPLGPWTKRETAELKAALASLPVDAPARVRLERGLDDRTRAAAIHAAGDPKLAQALSRFEKGAPRGEDVRAVEKLYDAALSLGSFDATSRARIIASIRAGGDGVPGWDALRALKREIEAGYNRSAFKSMFAFFGALAVSAAVGASSWPGIFKLIAAAGIFVPMGWMFFNIWRRDQFGFEADSINQQVYR